MAASSVLCVAMLVGVGIFGFVVSDCGLRINEVNINGPAGEDYKEFIELKWGCSETALQDATIVIWHGGKKKRDPVLAKDVYFLKGMTFSKEAAYFVLTTKRLMEEYNLTSGPRGGVADVAQVPGDGNFKKELARHLDNPIKVKFPEFLNNGKQRAIAIALYKGTLDLKPDSLLSEQTAHAGSLYDVFVYHEHGSAELIFEHLFAKDSKNGVVSKARAVPLKDIAKGPGNITDESLSYCCDGSPIPMWPLAFKQSRLTPGKDNDCSAVTFAVFGVHGPIARQAARCSLSDAENALLVSLNSTSSKAAKKQDGLIAAVEKLTKNVIKSTIQEGQASLPNVAAIQSEIESNGRQVGVLAGALGSLVAAASSIAMAVGYCYCKKKRTRRNRAPRTPLGIMNQNRVNLTDGSDSEDVMLERPGFQTVRVL